MHGNPGALHTWRRTALALVMGLIGSTQLPFLPPPGCLITTALLLYFSLGWRGVSRLRLVIWLAVGLVLGAWRGLPIVADRIEANCENRAIFLTGEVEGLVEHVRRPWGPEARFVLRSVQAPASEGCSGLSRVALSWPEAPVLEPGQSVTLQVVLRRPRGLANPHLGDGALWYALQGIDAVGRVKAGQLHATPVTGWRHWHHRQRAAIQSHIASLPWSATTRALLAALTIGDSSGFSPALWQRLRELGVNHLVVISGLHLGIVAGLGFGLGRLLALPCVLRHRERIAPALPIVLALSFALVYAALAGFSLPVTRALLMLLVWLVGQWWLHPIASSDRLLLALLLILAWQPLAALTAGLWLSFAAVGLLLWLGQWRSSGASVQLLGLHLYMSLGMAPLTSGFFGGVSVVSVLANLVLLPLVAIFVVPASLAAALATLLSSPMAFSLWFAAGLPLEWLWNKGADSSVTEGYYPVSLGLAGLSLAIIAVLLLPLGRRGFLSLLLPIALALWLSVQSARLTQGFTLTVLDVGQGAAVAVQASDYALLYDTGGGDPAGPNMASRVVLPFLQRSGVSDLDLLMISHPDLDHSAGLETIRRAMPVARLLAGGAEALPHLAYPCRRGQSWVVPANRWRESIAMEVLSPAVLSGERNSDSCVLRIGYRGVYWLLPGDIEASRERSLGRELPLRSDVLLTPHHGSNTSSTWSFIKRAAPAHVVHSAGYRNRFGHPASAVLSRYQALAITQHRTDLHGAIQFTVDTQGELVVRRERERWRRYWQ